MSLIKASKINIDFHMFKKLISHKWYAITCQLSA
jgi:hypothetical protein